MTLAEAYDSLAQLQAQLNEAENTIIVLRRELENKEGEYRAVCSELETALNSVARTAENTLNSDQKAGNRCLYTGEYTSTSSVLAQY